MLVADTDLEVRRDFVLATDDELVEVLTADARRDVFRTTTERTDQGAHVAVLEAIRDATRDAVAMIDVAVGVARRCIGTGDRILVERVLLGDLTTEGADVDVHRNRFVETPPVREDLRATFVGRIPNDAEARRPEVVELHRFGRNRQATGRIGRALKELREVRRLLLPTEANVDRDVRTNLPRVLRVSAEVAVVGVGL